MCNDRFLALTTISFRGILLRLHSIVVILALAAGAVDVSAEELHAQVVPQLGHTDVMVTSVASSPDGKTALTGSADDTARLWDVRTGRELRQFTGHSGWVTSVAFSPDSKTVLTGSQDKTARLWDVSTGRELQRFSGGSLDADSVAFSPSGKTVLTAGDSARLWDAATGHELRQFKGESIYINVVAFSPDGKSVLGGDFDRVYLWSAATGRVLREFKGHTSSVTSIAVSPDGKTLLSGSLDKTVRLWDIANGRELHRFLGYSLGIDSVAFSPDGKIALVAAPSAGKAASLFDVATGREIRSLTGPTSGIWQVRSARFSSDGRYVLTGGMDRSARLWDASTGKEILKFEGHASAVSSVAFSPNGRTILTGNTNYARLWDIISGREQRRLTGLFDVTSVAFSPDGQTILTADLSNPPTLWDPTTGGQLRQFRGHTNRVSSVGFSRDGRSVLTGSLDKTARLWDPATGVELKTILVSSTQYNFVNSVAFSPNGRAVLTGSQDCTARLWDATTGNELLEFSGHTDNAQYVLPIAFSPDGQRVLTGSGDKIARLWDANTGRELLQFSGHTSDVTSVVFSPDGRTVLTSSADKTARLWDVATGRELRQFLGHATEVTSAVFSPDGRTVLTGSHDGTARIWDAATGVEWASFISFSDGSWLTITPEGFFDASSKQAAQNLNIVRGLEVSSVDQVYDALYRPDLVREKLAGDPSGKVKAAAAQLDLDKVMASGMAPKVTITSPVSGSSSSTDEVAVEAAIADQGGGIGKVEWRVNGVTLGLESRGLNRIEGANDTAGVGRTQTVKRTLSLEPGDNRIEVLAYNAKGLIASEPAQVSVKWDGAKTATSPKLYVLAVGVNDYYDGRLHLVYAVPDATALAEGFKKAGSGLYADVEVRTVLDSDVTLANLDRVFADLSNKVQPRDVFVFFLAGHGKTKNGRYYFLPRDFRYEDESSIEKAGMGQDKFQAWFAEIPARKSLLLYDTCESGSLTGTTRGSDIDERLGALNRMARATGRTFLTATTDDAPALEGYHGHGVFTYALLDALDHADVNKNGLIEVSELADYIDQKVPDYSYDAFRLRQIPQRSIVGNNFAVTNKVEVLAARAGSDSMPQNKVVSGNIPFSSAAVSNKPTHVVIGPADVYEQPAGKGVKVEQLPPGTLLSLVKTEQGWVLIARDGKQLGYVAEDRLMRVQ